MDRELTFKLHVIGILAAVAYWFWRWTRPPPSTPRFDFRFDDPPTNGKEK